VLRKSAGGYVHRYYVSIPAPPLAAAGRFERDGDWRDNPLFGRE